MNGSEPMSNTLHEMVTAQALAHPDAVAVVFKDDSVSYAQLDELSNRMARALRGAGCVGGDRVAIMMPKSIEAIAAILGVLKAGCIYVPIDPASPAERTARMLSVCDMKCVLAGGRAGATLGGLHREGLLGENLGVAWLTHPTPELPFEPVFHQADIDSFDATPPAVQRRSGDIAHILFTSGSTGVPKGVPITHANALHFVRWGQDYFGIRPGDRISGHPPLVFDLSTFDIYGSLGAGAELHLVPPELNLLPHRLADFIRGHALTQWFSVPSVLNHMAKHGAIHHGDFPSLKRLLWCGEAFPTPALIHWMERLPNVTFTNLYGPTEATIASSFYTVPECPRDPSQPVSIGRACAGEELLILDENLQPVPTGKTGDLYIGGPGLSPGYYKDSKKTAAVFLQHPLRDGPGARIYKTGDLARFGDDGLVYLLGRADYQIKCRGHRIELGEIEAALHTLEELRETAVVAVKTGGLEGNAICCAYVPVNGVTPQELRRRLTRSLPHFMVPTRWRAMERLPLNGSGKIDRNQIKHQFAAQAAPASTTQGGDQL